MPYQRPASPLPRCRYLDKAVAAVLGFIGVKMLAEFGGVHIPTDTSLFIVAGVLGAGVGASLLLPEPAEDKADK